jgi:hypothetical protein
MFTRFWESSAPTWLLFGFHFSLYVTKPELWPNWFFLLPAFFIWGALRHETTGAAYMLKVQVDRDIKRLNKENREAFQQQSKKEEK